MGRERYVEPDDDIYALRAEYHGPPGMTTPPIRFTTIGLFAGLTAGVLVVEWLTGIRLPDWPSFEIVTVIAAVYFVMDVVDTERPLRAHVTSFCRELRRIGRRKPRPVQMQVTLRARRGAQRNGWAAFARWVRDKRRRKPPTCPPARHRSQPPAIRRPRVRPVPGDGIPARTFIALLVTLMPLLGVFTFAITAGVLLFLGHLGGTSYAR